MYPLSEIPFQIDSDLILANSRGKMFNFIHNQIADSS